MAKWRKVAAVTTASAMTMQLAACGSEETYVEETSEVVEDTSSYEEVTAEEVLDEDIAGIENSEYYEACADWDEQEDGSYVCDDEYSSYHGQNFFDGLMYATIGAMVASSFYKSKNKINGTKRDESTGGSSGGGYYGGSSSSSSKGTSGVTTNSGSTTNSNATTNPGSTTNSNTTTNSSSTSTSTTTTESNKAGTNKPSNGSTNYSSGKSGFSSGGGSRGGSSSS